MTLEPVEALKRRIAELESFLLNYDHAMKIERHDFKSEISALQTKLELARKFIDAFTKHHAEMCSTFLDDAPEDECDCAKGAATKLLVEDEYMLETVTKLLSELHRLRAQRKRMAMGAAA